MPISPNDKRHALSRATRTSCCATAPTKKHGCDLLPFAQEKGATSR